MILFILCSVILIPIQIYCEIPAAVNLELEDAEQSLLANDMRTWSRLHSRRSPNPPDNYLINKLARQYLAWKTLNKQNLPNPCDLFGNRNEGERKPLDLSLGFLGEVPIAEEYSGIKYWNTFNLSGRRQIPLYAEEPSFLMRREAEQQPKEFTHTPEEFIPPRGRKRSGLLDILDRDDYFQANRGKKSSNPNYLSNLRKTEKKARIQEVLNADLFYPNRGKKNSNQNDESIGLPNKFFDEFFNAPYKRKGMDLDFSDDSFMPNRGKKQIRDFDNSYNSPHKRGEMVLDLDDSFIPNRGKKQTRNLDNSYNSYNAPYKRGEMLLDLDDSFIPNRGKKQTKDLENLYNSYNAPYKRGEMVLDLDDSFIPNRGKKQTRDFDNSYNAPYKRGEMVLDLDDSFIPNRGKKQTRDFSYNAPYKTNDDLFPKGYKKATQYATISDSISAAKGMGMEKQNLKKITKDDSNMIVRRRRDLIDDMEQKKDTFYVARGRRTTSNLPKSLNQESEN